MFYILDFIYYRAAEIYARRGLGPIGPEKLYTGAHPDNLVSFPVAAITLIIPCLIYKLPAIRQLYLFPLRQNELICPNYHTST